MEQDLEYRRQLVEKYRKEVDPLLRYISWFEEKRGKNVSSIYSGNDVASHSVAFPVYDSTLMGFVKAVQRTTLTDRNYVYTYSRYRIKDASDELKLIEGVTLKNIEVLTAILSKYICGGMTKGLLWSQATEDGIFLAILLKFKELFDLWDQQ